MDEQKKPNCGDPQTDAEAEFEGVPAAEESAAQPEAVESETLKEEIRKLKEEVARGRADYFNLRTRIERDRESNAKLAAEQAINEMLPVFENLERIVAAVDDKDSSLAKGMRWSPSSSLTASVNWGWNSSRLRASLILPFMRR